MTVSRAFWKIVLKNVGTIITYTVILVMFGTMSMSGSTVNTSYDAVKANIVIFNHDEEKGVTKGLVEYLRENNDVKTEYEDDDKLKDALFYEQVMLVVDIPEHYADDFAAGRNPELKTRSSAGYAAELAKVVLNRYVTTAQVYVELGQNGDEIVKNTKTVLGEHTEIEVKKNLDTSKTSKADRYFSFSNYSILACVITIICLIMGTFNRTEIRKRNLVSSIEIKKMNRVLLRNCCLYSFAMWLLYIVIGFFTIGGADFMDWRGALYAANSLVFSICATTIAFLISNFIHTSGAVNGIMNVVALGSSFLCGAFVPAQYLPEGVLTFAHILPSYYYINSNNRLAEIAEPSFEALLPVLINIAAVLAFSVAFIVISNIVSKKRRKIA